MMWSFLIDAVIVLRCRTLPALLLRLLLPRLSRLWLRLGSCKLAFVSRLRTLSFRFDCYRSALLSENMQVFEWWLLIHHVPSTETSTGTLRLLIKRCLWEVGGGSCRCGVAV